MGSFNVLKVARFSVSRSIRRIAEETLLDAPTSKIEMQAFMFEPRYNK